MLNINIHNSVSRPTNPARDLMVVFTFKEVVNIFKYRQFLGLYVKFKCMAYNANGC